MEKLRYVDIPLITVDPFLNIWSTTDCLYDDVTRHWTDKPNAMSGFLCIDGSWYRFMGTLHMHDYRFNRDLPVLPQISCQVEATQTLYVFQNSTVRLSLTFTAPLLMDEDLHLMSRPVNYISYTIEYLDGQAHKTKIYFDVCSEFCSNSPDAEIEFVCDKDHAWCGSRKTVLSKSGDAITTDWGFLHIYSPGAHHKIYDEWDRIALFLKNESRDGVSGTKRISDSYPAVSAMKDFDEVPNANGFVCVAFDDVHSIEYFGTKLDGYWTETGDTFDDMLKKAVFEYPQIKEKCDLFDKKFRNSAQKISSKYADLACLSYRQILAAHKLVNNNGTPLFFSKECGSNGCLGTVDITYPSSPLFLIYRPELIEAMLTPVFDFAEGNFGWNYEFAPHDVGIYPLANKQVYGLDSVLNEYKLSEQMPVEECGNMLLCVAALCRAKGSWDYAKNHIRLLKQWAEYLVKMGWNPENQLCTDDFAGHLAHNCNLAIKGILGIAAFGEILNNTGSTGDVYFQYARKFANIWENSAFDGEKYRLAFDLGNSWSLKYNLLWDKFFGWKIFSDKVFDREIAFYKKQLNTYGVPLDSRKGYTKSDWQMWVAAISGDVEFKNMVIDSIWKFVNDSNDRIPFTDWYNTDDASAAGFFRNRTVQGGLFAVMLFE